MRIPLLISAVALVLATSVNAYAQDDPSAILARVDAAATKAVDFTARVELENVESNGKTTQRTFTVWQKGENRRMLKVTKPARLRGVGVLSTSPDELYMYLPSFGRVRRVAGQKRGEPFLGSNFTQDDMVRTGYGVRFTASLVKQDEAHWTLKLEPKKPKAEPHHHLVLTVRKIDALVAQVDCFDRDSREPTRQLIASDIREVDSVWLAHKIEAVDLDDKSRSTAVLHDVKVDTGVKDDFFSKRHLKRKPK